MLNGLTGIVCAMEPELALYKESLTETSERDGLLFGRLGPSRVVLDLCGPGKVNAAICAERMLLLGRPDRLLNTGVAGALSPELRVLDAVIGSAVCQHDVDTSALGDEPGFVSGVNRIFFPCDEALRASLCESAAALGLPHSVGVIASGDQFLADAQVKARIRERFHAACGEMESGAIGQVCCLAGVPFAALRVLSDCGDGSAPLDYREFMPRAAELSARILLHILRA